MNIQKNKQEHHHKVGKRIFNTLTKILAVANIEFATNYNALYGMPHLVAILAKMCRLGVTAEEAVNTIKIRGGMNVPSAKWFRNMVNSVSDDNVHKMCDKISRWKSAPQIRSTLVCLNVNLLIR